MANLDKGPSFNNNPPELVTVGADVNSYKSRAEILGKDVYANALVRASDLATSINNRSVQQAEFIAQASGIKLSPETLRLYAVLRGDTNEKQDYTKTGDQSLLAAVLYRQQNYDALDRLVKVYPNIFN